MTTYRQRLDAGHYKQGAAETATVHCPECGRGFNTEHALKIHQTKAHGNDTPAESEAEGYMQEATT